MTLRIEASWLADRTLQSVLATLNGEGEEARIVGGAVRNHLLGREIADVDIATTARPEAVIERATAAGLKSVPTGVEHGTVTLVSGGRPFEVTTLRSDHETDGRHAKVVFGRDWQADAERRDFTINALYCDASGEILDLVGGIPDIEAKRLRFIGDAAARIEEDYLRILRFYRFFAWYGEGRPDADGIKATTRLKGGLARLSAERVWNELRKLLSAPDPSRALLWMRQTGVLTAVLPESERWGIDSIHPLAEAENAFGWVPDAMVRLQAIVPPDAVRMEELARRLRFSRLERERMTAWAMADAADPGEGETAFRRRLYFGDRRALADRVRLALVAARGKAANDEAALSQSAILARRLDEAERFAPPGFELSGEDLIAAGLPAGPALGAALRTLQEAWVDSGFTLEREALLARARALASEKTS